MSGAFVNKKMQSVPYSVLDAISHECYLAALALALTIPDIYGRVEYPDRTEENVGSHYRKWFDHYVLGYKALGRPAEGQRYKTLNGYNCYLLRCRVLHNGTHDIEPKDQKIEFRLRIHQHSSEHPADGVGTMTSDGITTYRITVDVVHLCIELAESALKYVSHLTSENDTEKLGRLKQHQLDVDDLDEFIAFREKSWTRSL